MAIILHQLVTVRCSNNQFHAFSHALGLEKYLQSSLISFCQILFFFPLHNTKALATAYILCCLPITLISIASLLPLIPLSDCIHLLFLIIHLKVIWSRITFSFQIFIASVTVGSGFLVTEIPTYNVHSSEKRRDRQEYA